MSVCEHSRCAVVESDKNCVSVVTTTQHQQSSSEAEVVACLIYGVIIYSYFDKRASGRIPECRHGGTFKA